MFDMFYEKKFKSLPLTAKYVYLCLEKARGLTSLGIVTGTPTSLSYEFGLSRAMLRQSLNLLKKAGYIHWAEETDSIFLPHYLLHNKPMNPNHIKSWAKAFTQIQPQSLRASWLKTALNAIRDWPLSFRKAFLDEFAQYLKTTHNGTPDRGNGGGGKTLEKEELSCSSASRKLKEKKQRKPSQSRYIELPDTHKGLGGAVIAPPWAIPKLVPQDPTSPSYIPIPASIYNTSTSTIATSNLGLTSPTSLPSPPREDTSINSSSLTLSAEKKRDNIYINAQCDNGHDRGTCKDVKAAAAEQPALIPDQPDVKKEPEKPASPVFVTIPLINKRKDGTSEEYEVTEEEVKMWQELYPAVDAKQTFREIRAWNIANPTHRKTKKGIRRHFNIWFSNEQNRARKLARQEKKPELRSSRYRPLSPEEKRKLLEIPKEELM